MLSLRIRPPYTPALVRVGRARVRGCPCTEESAEVFRALDMPHAARMHAAGEGADWPLHDWLPHLDEEEAHGKFFDALMAVAATLPSAERAAVEAEVDALLAEHAIVRQGIVEGRGPDQRVADAHGARENNLAGRYKKQLLAYAAATVRTGVGYARVGSSERWSGTYTVDVGHPSAEEISLDADVAAGWIPAGEKFIDPWWVCVRSEETTGMETPEWEYHVQYLVDVPQNGRDRVAAMRSKIREFTPPAQLAIDMIRKQSEKGFENITIDIYLGLQTADGRKKLAEGIGIPVGEIEAKTKPLIEIYETYGKALQPLVTEIFKLVGPPIREAIGSAFEAASGAVSGVTSGFTGAVASIPMLGAMISFGLDQYAAQESRKDAENVANCLGAVQGITNGVKSLADYRLPMPWHPENLGVGRSTFLCPPYDPAAAFAHHENLSLYAGLINEWDKELKNLPIVPYRANIIRWWALASGLMMTQDVLEVFQAMGNDKWGGRLATDEMVMLVAAPIAIANNLDVDVFAEALWNRSDGWRKIARTPAGLSYLYKADIRSDKEEKASWPAAGGWKPTGEVAVRCGSRIRNAFFAQLAVLAEDAFVLLAEMTTKEGWFATVPTKEGWFATTDTPIFTVSKETSLRFAERVDDEAARARGSSSLPILGLGALVSGGLYIAGMSLSIVAAPITLAVLYALMRK